MNATQFPLEVMTSAEIDAEVHLPQAIFDAEGDGEYVTLGCIECREVVKARFGILPRFYWAECSCPECGVEFFQWEAA